MKMIKEFTLDFTSLGIGTLTFKAHTSKLGWVDMVDLSNSQVLLFKKRIMGVINENDIGFILVEDDNKRLDRHLDKMFQNPIPYKNDFKTSYERDEWLEKYEQTNREMATKRFMFINDVGNMVLQNVISLYTDNKVLGTKLELR